ncbi:MAG: porphobilinogen synthase [Brevinema sp.]
MIQRFRRLRRSPSVRNLVADVFYQLSQLVMPYFVVEGEGIKKPIPSMEGQYWFSIDTLLKEVEELTALGVSSVLLFGIPSQKDERGSEAWNPDGIVPQAIKALKKKFPDLCIIADVCLCEYTSTGHCGIFHNDVIDNDKTLPILAKVACVYAKAGADIIAPSDMMDGRITHLRKALDDQGFVDLPLMSYSIKYSSAYYGPFREAAHSAPQFGDRKSYQMDFCRQKEFLAEAQADLDEGADILMVKPGLAYLDILSQLSQNTSAPIAVYNVSGEYLMVKAAAKAGFINEKATVLENIHAFVRAGASIIITYHAKDIASWRKNDL